MIGTYLTYHKSVDLALGYRRIVTISEGYAI